MRLLCFIDILGSGGAQRQLVNLAVGFKKRGCDVSFLAYHADDFYLPLLRDNGIRLELIEEKSYLKRLLACRRFIRWGGFDAVLAFLEAPAFIAEFAGFPFRKWKLVVGERSTNPAILRSIRKRLFRLFHVFADCVVSNSEANRDLVKRVNPFLPDRRNVVIYNTYDLEALSPARFAADRQEDGKFHIVVAASHQRLKNLKNLALAISSLDRSLQDRLSVDWYGRQVKECFEENVRTVEELGLTDVIRFYPPTLDIYDKMAGADAVGLFSLYEGLSNTVCEAMCLGKPVLATDVSDNRLLLKDDRLISDASSPRSIAGTVSYLMSLPEEELKAIGRRNRNRAEELFSEDRIIGQYLSCFDR